MLLLLRLLLEDAITTGAVVDHLKLVRSTLWRSKRAGGAVQAFLVAVHLRIEKALAVSISRSIGQNLRCHLASADKPTTQT